MRLLLTGFEPFDGADRNPAWDVEASLPAAVGPWDLYRLCLPVEYGKAGETAIRAALENRADAVLCLGLAASRDAITPEMAALNLRFVARCDNAGNLPQDTPVIPDGPAAYFSTLPARALAEAIRQSGLPGKVSYSAGTFVCNDTLYHLLHYFHGTSVRMGFIHVPPWEPGILSPALTAAIQAIPLPAGKCGENEA